MSTEPIRGIIVGMGGVTREMLKTLGDARWFKLVGAVDVREEALAEARDQYGLASDSTTTNLEHALANTDATVVIVNTPSHLHFDQVAKVLRSGRHVLVAKPVTNDFDEAVALVELARANAVTLAVGQQMRYRRHYRAVAAYVASGALGTPQSVNFINAKPRPKALNLASMLQPALYEMSCHHFDCLMSVFPGAMPEWIVCDGFRPSWSPYAGPCMVNAAIRFSGNLHVLYQGGFSSQADSYEFRIEGDLGCIAVPRRPHVKGSRHLRERISEWCLGTCRHRSSSPGRRRLGRPPQPLAGSGGRFGGPPVQWPPESFAIRAAQRGRRFREFRIADVSWARFAIRDRIH